MDCEIHLPKVGSRKLNFQRPTSDSRKWAVWLGGASSDRTPQHFLRAKTRPIPRTKVVSKTRIWEPGSGKWGSGSTCRTCSAVCVGKFPPDVIFRNRRKRGETDWKPVASFFSKPPKPPKRLKPQKNGEAAANLPSTPEAFPTSPAGKRSPSSLRSCRRRRA